MTPASGQWREQWRCRDVPDGLAGCIHTPTMRDASATFADPRHAPAASDFWSCAIRRADALAAVDGPAADLLTFYAQLLRTQQMIAAELDRCHPTGSIEADAVDVARAAMPLVDLVRDRGPARLSDEADRLTRDGD